MAQTKKNPISTDPALLPLGAMLLAASAGAWAQTAPTEKTPTLGTVNVRAPEPEGRDTLRPERTRIGKGNQEVKDVPQSITTVTEKLLDDRRIDTVKDALKQTAGVTFQAAEGGEEDIRVRGFSLSQTGDIYIDGMRDPAFYDRDAFNLERIELLRGSASMLFGRGSTGGVVNQVSKQAKQYNEHEVTLSGGSHGYGRLTGDFNIQTGGDAGLRLNVMRTKADNNGSGSSIDKEGAAISYRTGIDTSNEVQLGLYYLNNNNGINYGLPWVRPAGTTSASNQMLPGLDPSAYYGMASDRSAGMAQWVSAAYIHRFDSGAEWRTQVRKGWFERDQRASTIRLPAGTDLSNFGAGTALNRGFNAKVQDLQATYLQTDFSGSYDWLGLKHQVTAGIDIANEQKTVYAAQGAAPVKPPTRVGTPDDGATVNEGARSFRTGNAFENNAWGVYAQDLVQVAPKWKLLGGARYDKMDGDYVTYAASGAPTNYQQKIGDWSGRVGALYQPNDLHTFHFSYGTSFNTSGDTYSYNALSANTPPEKSENIEIGGRLDNADRSITTRFALFRATKNHERNTDPDSAATSLLLTGKRHAMGVELDAIGRITPRWELYASYAWIPIAKVDEAASTATSFGNRVGDRPGLTPKHSGTVWSTYLLTPKWRVGGGVNFRSKQSPADTTPPTWYAPGWGTVDLMTEYTFNDQYSLRVNVNNVANKYYGDVLYRGHYVPGAGRLVFATLTARFF